MNGVDLDEIEVKTENRGDEEDNDVSGEDCEEGVAADDVLIDVTCPLALKEEERAEDDGADEKSEQSDADESPEVEEALLKQRAETRGCGGLVAEERTGDEEEIDEEVERNGGVAGYASGISDWSFVEMKEGFAEGAEIEAAGEALGGERVIQKFGEPQVKADGEEKGETEIEEVGPKERRESAQGDGESVRKDVAAFLHGQNLWKERAVKRQR